jgi:hypothetical protein
MLSEIPTLRPEPEPPPITASSVIHFIAAELSLQPSTRLPSDEYNDDIIDINTDNLVSEYNTVCWAAERSVPVLQ